MPDSPNETYRRYHAGRYPAKEGGPGEASYEEGSSTGYYAKTEDGQFIKPIADRVDLTATKALRKITGFSKSGESDIPKVTRERLKKEGVE